MKKRLHLIPAWLRSSGNRRNESIRVTPCDPLSEIGLEAAASAPAASVRVTRGNYTWSIPVRLFCAAGRAGR